jgi:phosphoribosyl-ATP pyrophosphohydrolase/phosphoribosyl-AMP cyclohydrolase
MNFKIEDLSFDEQGLIPAIIQDARTNEVLTLAYVNVESLHRTLGTNETWFWSRSRSELWHKGETSGNTQRVVEVRLDCDRDALIIIVEPSGPACHTGARTCFYNQIQAEDSELEVASRTERDEPQLETQPLGSLLNELYALIESRHRTRPEGSYTTQLFNEGLDKILAKVNEEADETVMAGKNESNRRLTEETSDLLYHLLVLLVERGVTLSEIREELARRRGKSAG